MRQSFQRIRILLLLLLIVVVLNSSCAAAETVRGDLKARFAVPTLERDGIEYRQRDRVVSVLLLGVDKRTDEEQKSGKYRSGGQADFLVLLVVDDNRDTITPIQINRDTMAEIMTVNAVGQEMGTQKAQICLSHGFGDGKTQSCDFTRNAVQKFLLDSPVTHYIAMNMDAIAALNDAIGGVEVTLEDDFSRYDPTMVVGKSMVLQGMQAEYYLRYRYGVGEQTNLSRQKRQKLYMHNAQQIVMNKIQESPNFVGKLFDAVEPSLVTDVSRGYLVNLANKVRLYEVLPMIEINGESVLGESGYMEFYPEDASVLDAVLAAFYEPNP